MNAYAGCDYVGADGHSYPEVASLAVRGTHYKTPSPVYGYLRTGRQQHIYLFGALEEARRWFGTLPHGQTPYDYAAVFVATDLTQPMPGLESFGPTTPSADASVGQVLPFLLGLPLGGVGGYFLRKWQEGHPGQVFPGLPFSALPPPTLPDPGNSPQMSGDYPLGDSWPGGNPTVGCACRDTASQGGYTIGGPWLDIETVVGAQDVGRRSAWPLTKALIQSAIQEVTEAFALAPAGAYVWSLEPASSELFSPTSRITLEGTTYIESFPSAAEALEYMRDRIQTPHVALALFNPQSSHWPNPTNWTKSNDPTHEAVIAQQAAKYAPARAAGAYVGAAPEGSAIGTALNDVRDRAQSIANKRAGRVIGVIHTTQDGLWHALSFGTPDDADDWFGTSTQVPESYTYAAYYDKNDRLWPYPLNEKIGGARSPSRRRRPIRRPPAAISGVSWGA